MEENRPSFEEALRQVREIVEELERQELPLEHALELFKRGCILIKDLKSQLMDARQKIEVYSKEVVREIEGLEEFDE